MLRGAMGVVLAGSVGIIILSCSLLVEDEGLSDAKCPAETCLGEDGRQRCVPSISPDHGCACPRGRKWCEVAWENQCVSMDDPRYGCATGSCGGCFFDHGEATCNADGECAFSTCITGYADCDRSADHSCETNIKADAQNCNGCGRDCLTLVAERTGGRDRVEAAACVERQCVVTKCGDGWRDCNEVFTDGCEVHVLTSQDHCGACGRPCSAGSVCSDGACE